MRILRHAAVALLSLALPAAGAAEKVLRVRQ